MPNSREIAVKREIQRKIQPAVYKSMPEFGNKSTRKRNFLEKQTSPKSENEANKQKENLTKVYDKSSKGDSGLDLAITYRRFLKVLQNLMEAFQLHITKLLNRKISVQQLMAVYQRVTVISAKLLKALRKLSKKFGSFMEPVQKLMECFHRVSKRIGYKGLREHKVKGVYENVLTCYLLLLQGYTILAENPPELSKTHPKLKQDLQKLIRKNHMMKTQLQTFMEVNNYKPKRIIEVTN